MTDSWLNGLNILSTEIHVSDKICQSVRCKYIRLLPQGTIWIANHNLKLNCEPSRQTEPAHRCQFVKDQDEQHYIASRKDVSRKFTAEEEFLEHKQDHISEITS